MPLNEDFVEWSQRIQVLMEEMARRDFVDFRGRGPWQPTTNVYETPAAYHVCVELAGVSEQEIDVRSDGRGRLTIQGVRSPPRPAGVEAPLSVHVLEVDEGPFLRALELPEPVCVEKIEAVYHRGFLWITIPKAPCD